MDTKVDNPIAYRSARFAWLRGQIDQIADRISVLEEERDGHREELQQLLHTSADEEDEL